MTNAGWWARVVQARTERADLRPQRVWTLHNGEHAAAIDLKAVPGIGAEIVLTVNGELPRTRLYRAHAQAELSSAIADTRTLFRDEGGGRDEVRSTASARGAGHGRRSARPRAHRVHRVETVTAAMMITIPTSGGWTFQATLEEDDDGLLWLNQTNTVSGKRQGRYLLNAVLRIGWRIVESTPEERALLEAHGLASGRVQ